jgi:hypothetical protein
MRRIVKFLALPVAAFGIILGTAGIASAHSDGPTVCNSDPESACVKFYNNGDVIRVWDEACDGHASVGKVEIPAEGIYDYIWNTAGCGTYVDHSYGTSVAEGTRVYYYACFGVYSTRTVNHCSGLGSGVA